MPYPYPRVRKRVTKALKPGSQKVGGFFSAVTDNGHFLRWSTVEINKQYYQYAAPYVKAELINDSVHQGPPYYSGDSFRSLKVDYTDPYNGVFGSGTYIRPDGLEKYVGGFSPPQGVDFQNPEIIEDPNTILSSATTLIPNLNGYGAQAWNKCKPKIEYADAYVFCKELIDVVHMSKSTAKIMRDSYDKALVAALASNVRPGTGLAYGAVSRALNRARKAKMMSPRYVGDQFLNHQFGWLPFLSDLRKFHSAYTNFIEINARITRRNGQWQRRKVTVFDNNTETKIASGTGSRLFPPLNNYSSGGHSWEVLKRSSLKLSAVGSWRVYLPEFDESSVDYSSEWNRMKRQLDIFGARISPINVYKGTPWTWANDWLNTSSSYLEYASDAVMNNLACKYFFLMGHQKDEYVFRQVLRFPDRTFTLEFVRRIESKQRLKASSPFDFSLSWNLLSPRQIAIAVALGLTRW